MAREPRMLVPASETHNRFEIGQAKLASSSLLRVRSRQVTCVAQRFWEAQTKREQRRETDQHRPPQRREANQNHRRRCRALAHAAETHELFLNHGFGYAQTARYRHECTRESCRRVEKHRDAEGHLLTEALQDEV